MLNRIVFLMSFLLISCTEKYIDYELPFEGEKLVLNGLLISGIKAKIKISHTWKPLGDVPTDVSVKDALVTLTEDAVLIDTLQYVGDSYRSNLNIKSGHKYIVRAMRMGYNDVISNEILVPKNDVDFSYQQTKDINYSLGWDTPQDQIDVTLNANKSYENVYAIYFDLNLKAQNLDFSGFWESLDETKSATNNDNVCFLSESVDFDGIKQKIKVYNSRCFLGINPTFHFYLDKAYYDSEAFVQGYYKIPNPRLYVLKLDENFWQYLQLKSQPKEFNLAFEAPHTTYTNINGGYGIIGAASQAFVTLTMNCKICK